jgi:DNA-binding CsgD family transcriptional regulator
VTRVTTRARLLRFVGYLRCASMKEAARVAGVSEQTVKNTLSDLYADLGVHNRIEALIALGWLKVPDEAALDQPGRSCGWIGVCDRGANSAHDHAGFRAPA